LTGYLSLGCHPGGDWTNMWHWTFKEKVTAFPVTATFFFFIAFLEKNFIINTGWFSRYRPQTSLPANIQRVCQSIKGWWTNYWLLPTRRCNMSHFKCEHERNWKFFKEKIISKNLATQISRSNACRLLFLGPIEGHSVQKYTPHNRTTPRRYTPRDSSR